MAQYRLLTDADGVMTEAQILTAAKQLQARTNISAVKKGRIVTASREDLDTVALEEGMYTIDGYDTGLLVVIDSEVENSVTQIFLSSYIFLRRTISKSTPVVYPVWIIPEGGTGGAVDISELPDATGLRATWSSKAAGNHNHDTAYLKPIPLVSVTVAPVTPADGDMWYDASQKQIITYIVQIPEPIYSMSEPELGKAYGFGGDVYKWNATDMVLLGVGDAALIGDVATALDLLIAMQL